MSNLRYWVTGCTLLIAACAAVLAQAGAQQNPPAAGAHGSQTAPAAADKDNSAAAGLAIEPAELPETYPHAPYHVVLQLRGNYVPVLHWAYEHGALPPGIRLDDNGVLAGQAQRPGEFQFVVTVKDGDSPQKMVRKEFVIKVREAIKVVWKVPPHVNVSRIEGSVDVSNTTPDDVDLTFDVKAVAENGRATEIGYQHFALTKGTVDMTLPFGETLPHGAYIVRVDVTGEIAKRQAIYKTALQTPGPLQVVPGP
jgi:hypothetical protein